MRNSQKLKILINAINYAPEMTGIGKYTGEMAEWLTQRGYIVRVVTAPPYYPAWKVAAGYSSGWYRREHHDGLTVFRCPLWVPRRPTGFTRILHLVSFALSCLPLMLWNAVMWRPHVVFVVEPPLFCAPGAWVTARFCRGKAWLHVQDFEVDAAFNLGLLNSGMVQRLVCGFERWLMRRFDVVSTISQRMMGRLGDKGVEPSRTLLFPNWVDTDTIQPLNAQNPYRIEFGLEADKIVALYSGNMGEKQGLEIVLEAARALSDRRDIVFILCGDGVARERLFKLSQGLTNVRFLPLQPAERLNHFLSMADIHLLPQRLDAEDLVMPSKLTAMFASGRPVVATAGQGTQIAEVVAGRGMVVRPDDPDAFWQAIRYLADHQQERIRMGGAARLYAVEEWSKDMVLNQIAAELGRIRGNVY